MRRTIGPIHLFVSCATLNSPTKVMLTYFIALSRLRRNKLFRVRLMDWNRMRIRVSVHCICQTSVDHLLNVHTVINHRSSYVVMCFIDMILKCDILLVGVFMLTRYHRKWRIHFQTTGEWCNVIFADVDFMRYNINRTIESSKAQ